MLEKDKRRCKVYAKNSKASEQSDKRKGYFDGNSRCSLPQDLSRFPFEKTLCFRSNGKGRL